MGETQTQDRRTLILDVAERRVRTGGYNGFSFRDIANDVGIKSASVHYHFPTKEELVEALVDRYTARTMEALGSPDAHTPHEAFDKVADLFLQSDQGDNLMCLCGLLGAESGLLANTLNLGVSTYFDRLIDWLAQALKRPDAFECAKHYVATLEGGLIMSRVKHDHQGYRRLVTNLRASVKVTD